jgi:hypothetical protein
MMAIRIRVEGATPEEIERGLAAAQAVFDKDGVTDDEAATAAYIVEGWMEYPNTERPTGRDLDIYQLWSEADCAAAKACCSGWPPDRVPSSADLELLRPSHWRMPW